MARRGGRPKKKKKLARSGIRFLRAGQSARLIGVRGKPVKRIVPGRKYVIEVMHGNRRLGYVNRRDKTGALKPQKLTKAQLARINSGATVSPIETPKRGKTSFTLTKKKFIKKQIPKRLVKEIKGHKNELVSLTVEIEGELIDTPQTYITGAVDEETLENLLTSQLIATLNRTRYRVSPPLGETGPTQVDEENFERFQKRVLYQMARDEAKNVRRVESAKVRVNFTRIKKSKREKVTGRR